MGKINSRNKGASFEREIASKLNDFFDSKGLNFKAKRNLEQYQEKDLGDLEVPNHVIECKRYAEGNWYKEEWWKQTLNSCGNKIPVLIWKYNRQPIRVCTPMYVINTKHDYEYLPTNLKDNSVTVVLEFEHWVKYIFANNL
tara:strand:- start:739 stop:1161 length:423 start_codon:yes stop_codon:yes gene_type:complete